MAYEYQNNANFQSDFEYVEIRRKKKVTPKKVIQYAKNFCQTVK